MRAGVEKSVVHLIADYLRNRKMKLRNGESWSEEVTLTNGTPQGSVLGPLLFLVASEAIKVTTPGAEVLMFADDSASRQSSLRPSETSCCLKDMTLE